MPEPRTTVRFRLGCDLSYEVRGPSTFVFNVEVARLQSHQDLKERLLLSPGVVRRTYVRPDANNRYVGVTVEPGPFRLTYEAEVTLDVHRADPGTVQGTPLAEMPLDIMPFLLPSRYVSSDRLAAFALREFGHLPAGHGRITAICNWIYDNIDHRRGASNEQTTADESLLQRAGVCRDFAHLGLAFCRALSVPSRFVSCHAYGLHPSDFHAVFEAYLGGRWWLFDATRQANLDGLVRIGVGRDAAEIAFAPPFGDVGFGPVSIIIERVDEAPEAPGRRGAPWAHRGRHLGRGARPRRRGGLRGPAAARLAMRRQAGLGGRAGANTAVVKGHDAPASSALERPDAREVGISAVFVQPLCATCMAGLLTSWLCSRSIHGNGGTSRRAILLPA